MKKRSTTSTDFNDAADSPEEFAALGRELLETITVWRADWTWQHDTLNNRVNDLLARGASVHTENQSGETALMLAIKRGQTEAISKILHAGADVNAKSHDGNTPLIYCSLVGDAQTALLLLHAGARAEDCNIHGNSMLTIAAARGFKEFIEVMVGYGISPDNTDNNNDTPLCAAAWSGQEETARVLIELGANPLKPGSKGKVAAEQAFEGLGSTNLTNTLMHAMKKVIEEKLADDLSQITTGSRKDIRIGKPLAIPHKKIPRV